MTHDIVETIVVHFLADILDHVLRACNNILIEVVRSFVVEDSLAHA